jgi:hypothetical protein
VSRVDLINVAELCMLTCLQLTATFFWNCELNSIAAPGTILSEEAASLGMSVDEVQLQFLINTPAFEPSAFAQLALPYIAFVPLQAVEKEA